jgi:hypothetical protein
VTDEVTPLPTVAVVLPTAGRRPEELLRSLRSVLADPATTEVVVAADIGAEVPLPEVPADPRVRVVRVPDAAEPSDERGERAREWAVASATADVVLGLEDDVVAGAGLVTGHASRHRAARGVVAGYVPVVQAGLALRWRPAARYYSWVYERACSRFERAPSTVLDGLWGGNVSVRRLDWPARDDDGASGGYHGDLALGVRLARAGLVGTFDRSLRAEHHYRRSLGELAADQEASAAGRLRLHTAYPDVVPAPDPRPRAALPRLVVGPTAAAARTDAGWWAVRRALVGAAYAAEAARLPRVADLVVRLLCRTAFARGLRRVS